VKSEARKALLFANAEIPKVFRCGFLSDVFCFWRKTEEFSLMERCLSCANYLAFLRFCDDEEDKAFAEFERIRKEHGELV